MNVNNHRNGTKEKIVTALKNRIFSVRFNVSNVINKKQFRRIFIGISVITLLFIALVSFVHINNNRNIEISNLKKVEVVKADKLNKQRIKESIENIQPYEKKLLNVTVSKNKNTESFNSKNVEIKNYVLELEAYKKSASANLIEVQKITCPKESEQYKSNVLNEYKAFIEGLTHEINYINNKDSKEKNLANDNYNSYMKLYDSNKSLLKNIIKLYK